jgi:hypothetical protein
MRFLTFSFALGALFVCLPAHAEDSDSGSRDRCQQALAQASQCYGAAQNGSDGDHVEGAEYQCDPIYRSRVAACSSSVSEGGKAAREH